MKDKIQAVQTRMAAITTEIDLILNSDQVDGPAIESLTKEFDGLKNTCALLRQNEERQAHLAAIPPGQRPYAALGAKEQQDVDRFSLVRFIRNQLPGQSQEGIEKEMLQEGAREAQSGGISPSGAHIPLIALNSLANRFRADITAGGSGTGLELLTREPLQGLVDPFYEALAVRSLGATYVSGLQGSLIFPKMGRDSTKPSLKTENAAATELTPTTALVTLTPHRLPAYIEVSKQALIQASPTLEAWMTNYLLTEIAITWEKQMLHGDGTGVNLSGLADWSGIGSVIGGTNGLAPTYANVVGLETKVANQDAAQGKLAYLTNTKVRGKLKLTEKFATTNGNTVWEQGNTLNGYTAGVSNAVSSALTQGSASAVCSAIFFGNWSDFIIAQWGGLDVLVNPYSLDTTGLIRINAAAYGDSGVLRAGSFAVMRDALTT